jgi:hypothetical protein
METVVHTRYLVRDADGYGRYGPGGYSLYAEMLRLNAEGMLPDGEEVYGYPQAIAHANELKRADSSRCLRICCITTIETSLLLF